MGETTNIVISASHNILRKPQSEVDAEIIRKAEAYRAKGKMTSYKFKRVAGALIDENKCLMALGSDLHLSSLDFLLIRLGTQPNVKISVVGSQEVKDHVELAREFLRNYDHHAEIIYVDEGEKPKIGDNFRNGKRALGDPRKFTFISGDIPHIDLDLMLDQYDDFDPGKHDLWLDCNSERSMFPDGNHLFDRNYYMDFTPDTAKFFLGGNPEIHPWKEPNIYFFGQGFEEWNLVNYLYHNREMGGPNFSTFAKMFKERGFSPHDKSLPITLLSAIASVAPILLNYWRRKRVLAPLSTAESLAKLVMGRRVKFSVDHNDPFRVKDIDAFHDLVFYMLVNDGIQANGGFESVYDRKTAQALYQFNTHFGEQRGNLNFALPLTYGMRGYLLQRDKELQMGEYRDGNGQLKLQPRKDEDIPATIEFLKRRKTN